MQGRKLRVFFDQDEIKGMQDWRQRILQGLRESRLLLACLSPAYLLSEYCQWEFVEHLEIGHLHGLQRRRADLLRRNTSENALEAPALFRLAFP